MKNSFYIHLKKKFVRVDIDRIIYILSVAHHVKIYTDHGIFMPHLSLKQLETILPEEDFSRVNRGTLVAHSRITSFTTNEIYLKDISFSFSDKYRKLLEHKLTVVLHNENQADLSP